MTKIQKNIAIILCGGSGSRIKSVIPKQYIEINETPIICHTINSFEKSLVDEIIVVVAKDFIDYFNHNILNKYKFKKISKVVEGGKERVFSVKNALDSIILNDNTKEYLIIIHDGARPFITPSEINFGIKECVHKKAVCMGVKSKDTVKITSNDNFIKSTPDRNNIWLAQTPQIFKLEIIKKAYENLDKISHIPTDDSSLVELIGIKVKMLQTSYQNIKITTEEDLEFARLILSKNKF